VVSFTLIPLYQLEKIVRYPSDRNLVDPRGDLDDVVK
jgi:hypothetical protein